MSAEVEDDGTEGREHRGPTAEGGMGGDILKGPEASRTVCMDERGFEESRTVWTTRISTPETTTRTGSSSGTNGSKRTVPSPRRTCSTTSPPPCSTTSRVTTRSFACRPSTPAHPSSTRQRSSGPSQPCISTPRSPLPRRFTGIEFALAHASPPSLFIIHKRERLSPDQGPSNSVPSPLTPSPPQSGPSPPISSSTTASTSRPMSTPCSQTDWYFRPSFTRLPLNPSHPAHFPQRPPVLPRPSSQTSSRLHTPFRFRMAHNRLLTRRSPQKA